MSHEFVEAAWAAPGIEPRERLVLLALAAEEDTGGAACSLVDICVRTWLTPRVVRKAIRELDRAGYLMICEEAVGLKGTCIVFFTMRTLDPAKRETETSELRQTILQPRILQEDAKEGISRTKVETETKALAKPRSIR